MKKIFRKENIFILIVFAFVLSTIIIKPLGDLDEIWNYNVARNIAKGLIPYKDISMITTPLLPIITGMILKILGNEIVISRILASILWTGILFTIYKIFKNLMKEKNISLIFTEFIGIIFKDIYCIDYNATVLLIALIILYQELKNIENVTKYNIKKDLIIRYTSRNGNMYKTKYRSNTCSNCSWI